MRVIRARALFDIPLTERKVYNGHAARGESIQCEKARIIGARALQISYGAPVLVDYPSDMIDPIDIAMLEFKEDVIPITVVKN